MSQAAPQTVFHLASLFLSEHAPSDIDRLINSNLLFANQLVEAMVQAKVWQLVNTGTSWQHFRGDEYCPVNLYAATKQAFEAILRYYVDATPLRAITLHLYDTYGAGDTRPKLFNFLRQVANQTERLAMSPGEQRIDLVHVDDVVSAYFASVDRFSSENLVAYEAYAVSSGNPIKLKDLVAIYARVLGRELPITWGGRNYRDREVMNPWSEGAPVPGWKPRVSLEDGIKKLINGMTV